MFQATLPFGFSLLWWRECDFCICQESLQQVLEIQHWQINSDISGLCDFPMQSTTPY